MMEFMKMRSFLINVSFIIFIEKFIFWGMDGIQGNSGIGGVFVLVFYNVMEIEKL